MDSHQIYRCPQCGATFVAADGIAVAAGCESCRESGWYLKVRGEIVGPVTLEALREHIDSSAVQIRRRDFESWKKAVKAGRVVVTSGPMLSVSVNGTDSVKGTGPGGIVRLPAKGGDVMIDAKLASPIGLRTFELIQSGKPVSVTIKKSQSGCVHRWQIRRRLQIRESCWLTVRGEGVPIKALAASIRRKSDWVKTKTVSHSAAIRVLVGGKPIRSDRDATALVTLLRRQREYYRTRGRYKRGVHRLRIVSLFDLAIAKLELRRAGK